MAAIDPFIVSATRQCIDRSLTRLKPREERVLRLRFGLGCKEHTLTEIGQKFSVGPQRIREIEAKALRKMKSLQVQKGRNLRGLRDAFDEFKVIAS